MCSLLLDIGYCSDTGMTLYWVNRGSVFLESVYFDSEWEASNHNRTQRSHTKNCLSLFVFCTYSLAYVGKLYMMITL